ncbi:MAG: response regulator [Lachnoclostridium sp.]|jgi:CheY-like chemotaxis protein|nr:response regulator [Lachnoclostridium sp.]
MNVEQHSYDFMVLIRSGLFNLPKLAADKPTLRVGAYFDSITAFLRHIPNIITALNMFAVSNADEKEMEILRDTQTILSDIGSYTLLPILTNMIHKHKDNPSVTASLAKNALIGINQLNGIIIWATKEKKEMIYPRYMSELSFDYNSSLYNNLSLPRILEQLKNDEASRKPCILAVDDTTIILKTISLYLGEKYDVYTLSDPTMLTETLKQITPELFILDYDMPHLTGIELIPIIRGFHVHKKTPIMFLTSIRLGSVVSSAIKHGVCDYLMKPINTKDLLDRVDKHIAKKTLF